MKEEGCAVATLKAIFTAQDNLSSAMAKAGNAGSKTTGIMQKLGKIGSVAMKGIVTAVTAAGTALLALGKKAINVGMQFETSMSQVMATMGIDKNSTFINSAGEAVNSYEMLSAAAEKMGAETAFTSSQAADALNYLALAGYNAEQATEALPTVLHLAGAGGMDLATASDMVTDSMAALGLEVNQTNLDRFADQMAKTASTTNTSVSQLGEATLTVGAVAKNLKNGTTELNTQLGILANVGIKGAEGGTHLRNVLLRLQSPTAKAAKQLTKLGVSVYDAQGNMRDTGEIFYDLKQSMKGMDQQQIDQVMSTIFNKTDIAAANALLAASGDEYNRIFSIIENSGGAAAEMYQTMLDNLSGDVAIFNSATEALYLALFKSANGTLRDLVQTGTSYMNRLLEAFNTGGFEGLVNELGNVLGDAVSEIMSFAPQIIEAGTSIILAFVESIGNNADTVAEAAVQIGEQLVISIIKIAPKLAVAFGKAIGSAAASLMRTLPQMLNKIPDGFYNALGLDKHTVVTKFGKFAGHVTYALRKLVNGDVFGSIDTLGKTFGLDEGQINRIKNVIIQLGAAFEKVKSAVLSVAKGIGQFISKFAKIGGIEAIIAGVAAGFIALKAINIGKTFVGFAKGIKKAGSVMKLISANKFLLIAAAIAAVVAGIVLLVKNWDKVKDAIGKGIDSVFGAGAFDKFSASLGKVGQVFGKMGGWAKDSFSKMKSAFNEGYKKGGLVGGIKAALGSIGESLGEINWSEIGTKAWELVKSGFSATGDWIKQKVLGDEYTPDASWGDVGSKIWNTIVNGISAAGDWIKQKVLGDEYTPDASWGDVGSKIWETIKSGISAAGDWLKQLVLGDEYTPDASWGDVGSKIWETIWNGITDAGAMLKSKLSEALGKIPEFITELLGGEAGESAEGILSSIGQAFEQSFGTITQALEPLKTTFEDIGRKLSELWQKLTQGGADGGPSALQAIGNALLTIGKVILGVFGAVATVVIGVVNGIINALGPLLQAFASVFGAVIDIITAVVQVITGDFSGAWESIKSAFSGIWEAIKSIGQAIGNFFSGIWDVVSGVIGAISGAFAGIGSFISGIWTSVVNGLISALNWCIDRINDLTGGLSSVWTWTGLEGIGEIQHIDPIEIPVKYTPEGDVPTTTDSSVDLSVGADMSSFDATIDQSVNDVGNKTIPAPGMDLSSLDSDVNTLVDGLTSSLDDVSFELPEPDTSGLEAANQQTEQLATSAKSTIDNLSGLELPDLSGSTTELEGINSAIAGAQSDLSSFETDLDSLGTTLSGIDWSSEGESAMGTFATGLTTGTVQADTAVSTMGTTIAATASAITLNSQGSSSMATYAVGLLSKVSSAIGTVKTAGSGIKAAASSISLNGAGANVMRGLINGLESMRGSLMSKAQSIANQLKSTIQKGLEVHSPSRFTDWVGKMMGQGLVNGLEGMAAKTTAAAAAMALGVTSAFAPVALATPAINTPSVSQSYSSAAPLVGSTSPYEALGGSSGSESSGASGEQRIVIDINGGGRIDVGGLTKEQAMQLIEERVKPALMNVLEKEIFEGGDGTYEF